jgi:tetraacyldisaccharide 4'-kinase
MKARRPLAWPLVPLYAAGLWLKEKLHGEAKKLAWPVVSVGSISAGGAGKTPVVIALAELLRDAGWGVDVLSRGYGRKGKEPEIVRVAAENAAEWFGDEPVLIAEKTGLPVWVSGERLLAGQAAERSWQQEQDADFSATLRNDKKVLGGGEESERGGLHLLDDGFQHRQLARDFDIVLVTLTDLDDALLPAGNRREPLAALRRADAVFVRQHERDRVVPRIRPLLREDVPVWVLRRQLAFAAPLGVLGAGLRPLAFCAIARPEEFSAMVQAAGCGLVDTLFFADHHRYEARDVDEILATAKRLKATGFVTTEKDAVKLTPAMRERLATIGPLMIAELLVSFGDPELVLRTIEGRLE